MFPSSDPVPVITVFGYLLAGLILLARFTTWWAGVFLAFPVVALFASDASRLILALALWWLVFTMPKTR